MLPRASIIISTYNRAPHLENALQAVERLDYPDFEVVVVNGPSTDHTARSLDAWRGRIKMADCAQANISMSRNKGIAAASGEIICFMDDDAAPHPQWLRRLASAYADPAVGGVGGFTIDNTGVRWQVRKTVCDRFGNAFNVSDFFDERPLNRPGTPYYPSLLGTNSSFRAEALHGIGGFDNVFAYLLEETDVCLRLVDAGWKILYEPTALIYHQFAASHIRSTDRIARTLLPSAVSKGYFIMRHGAAVSLQDAATEIDRYASWLRESNGSLEARERISGRHRFQLDQELAAGLAEGQRLAASNSQRRGGDLQTGDPVSFLPLPLPRAEPLRVAMVSQGWPPEAEAGIARWTEMVARGLAVRGYEVHVLTRTSDDESVVFDHGVWVHRMLPDDGGAPAMAARYDLPLEMAAWCARVWREAQMLKSFGVRLVSFPVWDLEGLPLLDDPDFATVLSLHTTYALTKPFKPEWNARPLFEHHTIGRMIAAEGAALARAPVILANSQAIIAEIDASYGADIAARSILVPHGTPDPLPGREQAALARRAELRAGAPLRVLFAGRFERRKGFDIAADVADLLTRDGRTQVWFAGDVPPDRLAGNALVHFPGVISRAALDDAYVACDLLLAPSRFESFGLIGIEAMAAGRPVLALRVGGLAEVIEDGVTGLLFEDGPDAARRIAEAIARLDADRVALAAMGEAARRAYEARYRVAAMVDGIEALYRHVIDANSEARDAA
ncbi:glycosyltransferase [Iodidimonas sp. SYSU 1G8]|uniref:glycosyltransferase n=1 Tax=Iodidimonas sp. SYSU 1G8 TaxID=3133967 RepID=UPI0031FF3CC1